MNQENIRRERIFVGVFFILIAFLIFYGINDRTLHIWDEARLGMNAANMFITKNYFYTQFDGAPDFWNTKPHLLILLQVLSMKWFGFTEGSFRFPSAMAVLLSSFLIFTWLRKTGYEIFYAFIGVLAFICNCFLKEHGAKTGDYESLLIFWQLNYCYAIFKFINTEKENWLFLGYLTLTLAVLTKGITGILLIPGIVIFALIQNKIFIFLRSKAFYLGLIFFIIAIGGYYKIHDFITPGYMRMVYLNEVGGRYFHTIEGHNGNNWYYFKLLSIKNFYFSPILLINLVLLVFNPSLLKGNLLLQYLVTLIVSFFIILSVSHTKLEWYFYPLYPLLGMVIAILSEELSKRININMKKRWIHLLIATMIFSTIGAIIGMSISLREKPNASSFIKNGLLTCQARPYKIVIDESKQYNPALDFEIDKYLIKQHQQLTKITTKQISSNDWIIAKKDQLKMIHNKLFAFDCGKDKNFSVYKVE